MTKTKCGFVALIGRPNVGKSTLTNTLIGQKLVITSRKPQTTRHTILGIKTTQDRQIIFVDTPGFRNTSNTALHRYLNKAASSIVPDVDILLWVVDAKQWTEDDEAVLALLKHIETPTLLILNKVDMIAQKDQLLPLIQSYQEKHNFVDVVPISALKKQNIEGLEKAIAKYLPEHPFMYDKDQLTDRDDNFIFSEIIREKLMRNLGQEVPYSIAVEIELVADDKDLKRICAILWVERKGQKAIVIGKKGETLKRVGQQARIDIEKFINKKVFLELWVKVREDWSDNDKMLQNLGYNN